MEFDALLAPTLRPPLHLTLLSPLVTGLRRARRPTHPFVHATPLSLITGAPPGGLCSRLVSTRALLLVVLVLALPVGGKGCGGKGSGGEGGGGGGGGSLPQSSALSSKSLSPPEACCVRSVYMPEMAALTLEVVSRRFEPAEREPSMGGRWRGGS
mmetsp:Transcript_26696/g.84837  ORF Transcript_26696/g.84837 Transcript_26696/m.84837 type:complete len:155 (+) Transcript_26696:26-490(+)